MCTQRGLDTRTHGKHKRKMEQEINTWNSSDGGISSSINSSSSVNEYSKEEDEEESEDDDVNDTNLVSRSSPNTNNNNNASSNNTSEWRHRHVPSFTDSDFSISLLRHIELINPSLTSLQSGEAILIPLLSFVYNIINSSFSVLNLVSNSNNSNVINSTTFSSLSKLGIKITIYLIFDNFHLYIAKGLKNKPVSQQILILDLIILFLSFGDECEYSLPREFDRLREVNDPQRYEKAFIHDTILTSTSSDDSALQSNSMFDALLPIPSITGFVQSLVSERVLRIRRAATQTEENEEEEEEEDIDFAFPLHTPALLYPTSHFNSLLTDYANLNNFVYDIAELQSANVSAAVKARTGLLMRRWLGTVDVFDSLFGRTTPPDLSTHAHGMFEGAEWSRIISNNNNVSNSNSNSNSSNDFPQVLYSSWGGSSMNRNNVNSFNSNTGSLSSYDIISTNPNTNNDTNNNLQVNSDEEIDIPNEHVFNFIRSLTTGNTPFTDDNSLPSYTPHNNINNNNQNSSSSSNSSILHSRFSSSMDNSSDILL